MRRALAIFGTLVVLLAVVLWIVWFAGIVFEFEYPYRLTLIAVAKAKSVSGESVSKIIKGDGADWSRGLHWHTCSYCCDLCGTNKSLMSVHLEAPDKSTIYYFAYCPRTHILVPMTDRTAAQFPSLVPEGDQLQSIGVLERTGRITSTGYGEMKLPAKWYKSGFGSTN